MITHLQTEMHFCPINTITDIVMKMPHHRLLANTEDLVILQWSYVLYYSQTICCHTLIYITPVQVS